MAETREELTKTRTLVEQTIHWANRMERLPVGYLLEDRAAFRASPAPVLEFVYHASGGEVEIALGPYHYVSRPGTVLVLSTCQGYRATPSASVSVWDLSLHIGQEAPVEGLAEAPLRMAASHRAAAKPAKVWRRRAMEEALPHARKAPDARWSGSSTSCVACEVRWRDLR